MKLPWYKRLYLKWVFSVAPCPFNGTRCHSINRKQAHAAMFLYAGGELTSIECRCGFVWWYSR